MAAIAPLARLGLAIACLTLAVRVVTATQDGPATAVSTPALSTDAGQARIARGAARLYDTSVLHHIDIVIAPADAALITLRRLDRVRATFTIDGQRLEEVGVRQSGGIYHPYLPIDAKPSLSVKFDEFRKDQRLFGLEKLVLKNELQDVSFLSEHITYEIFRRAGLAAPLTAHAQVTINGIDVGIYLMREPIDKSFLARNFGSAFTDGNLYEIENRIDPVFSPSTPQLDDEGKKGRTRGDLQRLSQAVRGSTAETFVRDVGPLVDIDRLATFVAAETSTVHWDGLSFNNNNTYMYAHPKDGRFIFIPWGADQTLGLGRMMMFGRFGVAQDWLVSAMLEVPALAARVQQERTRIEGDVVWSERVLLDRIAEVARILDLPGASGRTALDIGRFNSYRTFVEATVRQTR